MRAAFLALVCTAAGAVPPVTQEDALAFHASGLCSISTPGAGLTRADGDGWIVSPLPGKHRMFIVLADGRYEMRPIDFTPGEAYKIRVLPAGAPLEWCPAHVPPGRAECGLVPRALLWDAKKATDQPTKERP
jgi:hypothetical protein